MPASQKVIKVFTKVISIGIKEGLKALVPGLGLFAEVIGGIAEGTVNFQLDASQEKEAKKFIRRIIDESAKAIKDLSEPEKISVAGYAKEILNFHTLTPADIADAGFDAAKAAEMLLGKLEVQNRLENFKKNFLKPSEKVLKATEDVLHAFCFALMSEKNMALTLEAEFRCAVMAHLSATTPQVAAQTLVDIPVLNPDKNEELSPGTMLRAENASAVPFTGRNEELRDLITWAAGDNQKVRVTLYTGHGGLGKTRLMLELCHRMGLDGWRVGFINPRSIEANSGIWAEMVKLDGKTLLVMDYAETRLNKELIPLLMEAGNLVNEMGKEDRKLRIVLISRSPGEWWKNLWEASAHQDVRRLKNGGFVSGPLSLADEQSIVPLGVRKDIYQKAITTFAPIITGQNVTPVFPEGLSEELYNNILLVQIRALLQIYGDPLSESGTKVEREAEILDCLLAHERGYWNKNRQPALEYWELDEMELFMAYVTVVGGVTEPDALELFHTLRRMKDYAPQVKYSLLELLHRTYPGTKWINPIMPDIFGEHLVQRGYEKDPTFMDTVFGPVITS